MAEEPEEDVGDFDGSWQPMPMPRQRIERAVAAEAPGHAGPQAGSP